MQNEFIADTTTQYQAVFSPSAFFSNTYNLTLFSRNGDLLPPPPPPAPKDWQSSLDKSTTTLASQLDSLWAFYDQISPWVAFSTQTYVYGWANGQVYERAHDLRSLDSFMVNCSSSTYFDASFSTSSWDGVTCMEAIGKASDFIYQQNFSTPTTIPGYP